MTLCVLLEELTVLVSVTGSFGMVSCFTPAFINKEEAMIFVPSIAIDAASPFIKAALSTCIECKGDNPPTYSFISLFTFMMMPI